MLSGEVPGLAVPTLIGREALGGANQKQLALGFGTLLANIRNHSSLCITLQTCSVDLVQLSPACRWLGGCHGDLKLPPKNRLVTVTDSPRPCSWLTTEDRKVLQPPPCRADLSIPSPGHGGRLFPGGKMGTTRHGVVRSGNYIFEGL